AYSAIKIIPNIEAVVEETIELTKSVYGIDISMFREVLRLTLLVSPLIVVVFMVILGAVFGALLDFLIKRMGIIKGWCLTIFALACFLILPNIVFGALAKALENTLGLTTYAIVLLILTLRLSKKAEVKA
ncbi:MAG: hypothetical protein DRO08_04205, partial [Thermoprotei archaeon]